jgi:hypothetical protein
MSLTSGEGARAHGCCFIPYTLLRIRAITVNVHESASLLQDVDSEGNAGFG